MDGTREKLKPISFTCARMSPDDIALEHLCQRDNESVFDPLARNRMRIPPIVAAMLTSET